MKKQRPIVTLGLKIERDVVMARQRARQIARLLGFDGQDQTRLATSVSEIARNAFRYAGGGKVEFLLDTGSNAFLVRVIDEGEGIANLRAVLDGQYRSQSGMGIGIIGTRRLSDLFEIESKPASGTVVLIGKYLPKRTQLGDPDSLVAQVTAELAKERPSDPVEEIQLQNQELLQTLEELRRQKEALSQANTELEETNRGVVALYAELDERADYLQRANDIKTRFLSNMTHEFRTPLNSIISLTRILLQGLDGDLSLEQKKQVQFIAKSADGLSDLVNDLLDLAKVEAGKVIVRPSAFAVSDLFGALRGMLKPLLAQNSSVSLHFDDVADLPTLFTDESKVSQILRNFISNALKYTDKGEVRISAARGPSNTIVFSVADTGIGIAANDQERIFDEFIQLDNPQQRRIKGTGLGLPLSRKLASLLGGNVRLVSQVGVGSTFSAVIPTEFEGNAEMSLVASSTRVVDITRSPVLVIEDNRETMFVYEKYLEDSPYQLFPARTLEEARDCLRAVRPVAIVTDILLESGNTWAFLDQIKNQTVYRDIPVAIVTMIENEKRALAAGAVAFHAKPIERSWLLSTLDWLKTSFPQRKILVVDDDPVARYLLRGLLADLPFVVVEAENGEQGLKRAVEDKPAVIFLDLVMDQLDGFEVLARLKSDPTLGRVPIIVHTSKDLSQEDYRRLLGATAIIPKMSPSRNAMMANIRSALDLAGLGPASSGVGSNA